MKQILLSLILIISNLAFSQTYTSYFTGNTTDLAASPSGGICMMGGATEHDEAMKWFLNRADGGDVLILRASGSDGYNNYMYSSLGITLNSVETIVFNSAAASNETYIHDKIKNAEAIWFAGGDQWDYITYWRNTPIDSLINKGINERNMVVGGTSAGMAILGKYYFSAENGTVTSAAALANPFNTDMTVDSTAFLKNTFLENVITDSHYDDPDRKGRHVAFLARILVDYDLEGNGIACNEYTAVCIDTNGIAKVYGDYPSYDEDAYFLQLNCELSDVVKYPETCVANSPLTWDFGQQIIKVYKVHGTNLGSNTFNLNTWESGTGGEWQTWYVENGTLHQIENSAQPNCSASIPNNEDKTAIKVFPNPVNNKLEITTNENEIISITIYDLNRKIVLQNRYKNEKQVQLSLSHLNRGVYFIEIETNNQIKYQKLVKT